jgi:hypothetical protein
MKKSIAASIFLLLGLVSSGAFGGEITDIKTIQGLILSPYSGFEDSECVSKKLFSDHRALVLVSTGCTIDKLETDKWGENEVSFMFHYKCPDTEVTRHYRILNFTCAFKK